MKNWTEEQINWMLNHDNKFYYYGMVVLAKCTGKDLEDILKMKWEDIDLNLERKLSEYLLIYKPDSRHGLIFKKSDGSQYSLDEFADEFNAYCIRRNIDIRI